LRCGDDNAPLCIEWQDRRLGAQRQNVTREVGDFVLQRADGPWAYQLAVVVDDADQGVTDVVRGEDLADNTARQVRLQLLLGLPTPSYLHAPLVCDARGAKLSKSNGAAPLDVKAPVSALRAAAQVLGLVIAGASPSRDAWLAAATVAWRCRGLMFATGGQTWHQGTTVVKLPAGKRTITHLQSLSLPAHHYYFSRPLTREQAVGLASGRFEPIDLPGFVGQVSPVESLCPALAQSKQLLLKAHLHWPPEDT
jgi:hypothetical protein